MRDVLPKTLTLTLTLTITITLIPNPNPNFPIRKCTSCHCASIRTRYCLLLLAQGLSPHCLCNNSIIVGFGWVKCLPVLSNSLLTLYGGCGSNHIIDPGVRSMRTYSIIARVAITANAIGVYIEDTRHDSGKSGELVPCSSLSNLPRGLSCLAEHLIDPSGLSEDLQG